MDPISVSAVLSLVDWKKVLRGVTDEAAGRGVKKLLGRLTPDEGAKAAKTSMELFVAEFLAELDDKTPLSSAVPGYHDQLKRLIEDAAPDITGWFQPETNEVDLAPVARMWDGLGLDPLPEGFDWAFVATSYAKRIRRYMKSDADLRKALETALLEQQTDSIGRMAGPDPGFDLTGYREYLRKKCALLQLSAMHTSTYDRRVNLWNVFVAQSARESAPVREIPRELLRRLRMEGQVTREGDEFDIETQREGYRSSPVGPVLEILRRDRTVVVLGDPGSGKTSLLKFLAMRWVKDATGPLPIWIDLKEYVQERAGLLKYCETGYVNYGLDARELERRLRAGTAAFYLDGLDEIFDGPTRGSVIEEIIACASRYTQASLIVTSRIVGYEAERLGHAGFRHATLEDFDDKQVAEFLSKWHEAAEEEAKERVRFQSRLERALRESRAVRELAGNPLLLTMMAILNRNQELPRDRVELYQQASRVLLHEWDSSRSLPMDTFARQEKEELLRQLAGEMQQREGGLAGNLIERGRLVEIFRVFLKNLGVADDYIKATSLVKQLTERNFILCFAGADRFSFVHRTFLEYFCAAWFVELFQKKQTLTLEQLKNEVFGRHWRDETWHEVLRLIAGMVGEKQAEELIRFLMSQDGRYDKLANLMLAAGCLSEVRNRRAIQETDDALWQMFVETVVCYDPPYYYESYEEFSEVSSTREKGVGLMASVWRSETTRNWFRSAAACGMSWIVRKAAVQVLARSWMDDVFTLGALKGSAQFDDAGDVREAAVQEVARGWKDDGDTPAWLKECARSNESGRVRRAAVQELVRGWKDDGELLAIVQNCARKDEDSDVRLDAVQQLARGWREDAETLPILKKRLRFDGNDYVRMTALQELARGWKEDAETLPMLKEMARFAQSYAVKTAAVQELVRGWSEDAEALAILKERAVNDTDEDVFGAAVQELRRRGKDNAELFAIVKERAQTDGNGGVRTVAVQELARGWKEDPETVAILRERARCDSDMYVLKAAVRELVRRWKTDEGLASLSKRARSDESSLIRMTAVQEIARGWREEAGTLRLLLEIIRSDEVYQVRMAAVRELARGWTRASETLRTLQQLARSDRGNVVRIEAVRELARGWREDAETLTILRERARSDEDSSVRETAAEELMRGWGEEVA